MEDASPDRSGARSGTVGAVGRAAFGGTLAFGALIVACGFLGFVQFLTVGVYGLWSWIKVGLLTAALSTGAGVTATIRGRPFLPREADAATLQLRLVPMVLTIGFLWLAARAGRRAGRRWSARSGLPVAALAAAGAAVPVAILSAACATLVDLSFPGLGLRLRVDPAGAALWAGIAAAAGAGVGASLEAARGRASTAALRGGLAAYGWALGLLIVGVFVVATLEPAVTRAYVNGVTGLGAGGEVLLGYHVLAFPAQSALLLAPASGSCLEVVGEGARLELCPWRLVGSGPVAGGFLTEPLVLSPALWLLNAVPFVAAMLGGRRAVSEAAEDRRAFGLGSATGLVFAALALIGGWFAAPHARYGAVPPSPLGIPVPRVSVHPGWLPTAIALLAWGVVGGGVGAWLATRGQAEPGLPRPTSA